MTDNLQILLREKPNGKLTPEHFEQRTTARGTPNDSEVLVRSVLLSLDAANRARVEPSTVDHLESVDGAAGRLSCDAIAQQLVGERFARVQMAVGREA